MQDDDTIQCMKPERLRRRLHNHAVEELNEHLRDNECAVTAIEGVSAGAIIVTNHQRILVFKKGMLSGVAFGRRMYEWHFNEVKGVRVDMRIMNGYVGLELHNKNSEDLKSWGAGNADAWESSHAIAIDKGNEDRARKGAALLRKMLHQYQHQDDHRRAARDVPTISTPFGQSNEDSSPLVDTSVEASPSPISRFCSECGSRLQAGAKFCSSCGFRVV